MGKLHLVDIGQRFLGGAGALQQAALGGRVEVAGQARLLDDPAGNGMVEIVTAQSAVAASRQHLEHPAGQPQDGNVEGAAAEVVDRHHALGLLVEAVGHRCSGRLVEQAQHAEASQARSVLGGLALGIVEIGRDGDHRADQLTTKGRLGALAQALENLRRDFYRALRALHRVDERHVRLALDEAIRQLLAEMVDVFDATAHQALDRQHGIERIAGSGGLGGPANLDAVGVVAHRGRQDHLPIGVGQRRGQPTAHRGDQRIGGAQVDTHGQAALVGLGTLTGLGDLQ
ncbi:NAD-specific glutamate dehydrogenase [compost metagenome]